MFAGSLVALVTPMQPDGGIDIAEVSTRTYPAAHTGAQMFAVQMIINVPKRLQLAHLREEFMDYCDAQNLDAILEPVKS
jgi:glycine cleavage system transcriptional repressor